jgi:predicted nucleic acid-binding protein
MQENEKYVLDSHAVLCFFYGELGAKRVKALLKSAQKGETKIWMSWINAGEVYYSLYRKEGKGSAEQAMVLLKTYPVHWVEINEKNVFAAAELKALHPIAFADCFAAAIALQNRATVITGDPEFKVLENKIAIEWLPGK